MNGYRPAQPLGVAHAHAPVQQALPEKTVLHLSIGRPRGGGQQEQQQRKGDENLDDRPATQSPATRLDPNIGAVVERFRFSVTSDSATFPPAPGATLHVKFQITATGLYVPPTVETAVELAPRLGCTPEWIREVTGVDRRHVAQESWESMAAAAGRAALG
ncbi:MAG: hypothetical protein QGG40_19690, partial [Myxococcota bacterium]|nr:hypothetical protein [Myxococcota bacterium]